MEEQILNAKLQLLIGQLIFENLKLQAQIELANTQSKEDVEHTDTIPE